MATVQTALRAAPSDRDGRPRSPPTSLAGLSAKPKRLPPKYFYDVAGSALFERITQLPEYYPTRCEIALLREQCAGDRLAVSAELRAWSSSAPARAERRASCSAPRRRSRPMCRSIFPASFCSRTRRCCGAIFRVLRCIRWSPISPRASPFRTAVAALPRVGFFPGSTIGNFEPHEAAKFLRHAGDMLGAGAVLVIGVDLVKDAKILCPAYNDAEGVTAKFNLNLLARINRELGADFDLDRVRAPRLLQSRAEAASKCISPAPSGRR